MYLEYGDLSSFLAPAGRHVYSNGELLHPKAPAGRHVCPKFSGFN